MGNCGRKLKRDFNSFFYKRQNGTARIGSAMVCPKCDKYFGPNTTYNTMNNHLDTCLANNNEIITSHTSNSNMNIISQSGQSMIISNNNNNNNKLNEDFVWIKKINNNHEINWEKQIIHKTLSDNELTNTPLSLAKAFDFENKQRWFRLQCEKNRIPWRFGADHMSISKNKLLQDSFEKIKNVNLYKEVKISFAEDNKVLDAGGLLREWIHLLIKEIFSPALGIFKKADTDDMTYTISPYAESNTYNLDMLTFVGKLIGKAIFEFIPIYAHLDRCLLKHIISRPLTLEDLEFFDKQIYQSLVYIKDTPINGIDLFEEYFSVPNGDLITPSVDLKPEGAGIRVVDENKLEYIQLKVEWLGYKQNEAKINAFLRGLNMVIPKEALSVFEANEIEMILNGLPFIDIEDWEQNTIYKGSYYKNHEIIRWFWKTLKTLNQKELSKFLQFCTGSSRVPVEGFRILQSNRGEFAKFCIESIKYGKDTGILRAHTCFNRLDLPQYPNEELLKQNIKMILDSDFSGVFGIEQQQQQQ